MVDSVINKAVRQCGFRWSDVTLQTDGLRVSFHQRCVVCGRETQKGKLNAEDLTPAGLARLSPPQVANPSDNLKNLFELPAIFYALVLYLYVTVQVDALYAGAAWVFVGFRFLHSAVHCTVNIVVLRFWLCCISALALWFMAGRAALHLLL